MSFRFDEDSNDKIGSHPLRENYQIGHNVYSYLNGTYVTVRYLCKIIPGNDFITMNFQIPGGGHET